MSEPQLPMTIAPPAGAEIAILDPDTQKAIYEMRARLIVAKQSPRDEDAAVEKIRKACQRRELAEKYEYNVPGRGRGPSIRLAEELARNWGNFETGTKIISQDEEKSTVEVYALDLENNYRKAEIIQVKHVFYSKSGGARLTNNPDDIYNLISNRASRRLRECIFKNIPSWVKEVAVEECKATLSRLCTPEEKEKIVATFKAMGVSEAQLVGYVGRPSNDFNSDDLSGLRALWRSIKDGEATIGDAFGSEPGVVGTGADLKISGESKLLNEATIVETTVEVKEKKPKKSKVVDTGSKPSAETVESAESATTISENADPLTSSKDDADAVKTETVTVTVDDDDPF